MVISYRLHVKLVTKKKGVNKRDQFIIMNLYINKLLSWEINYFFHLLGCGK